MPCLRETPCDVGTRIELVDGDDVLSGLQLWDLGMRIGNATFRCGGIGGVGTPRQHRMKGYSRQVLEGTVAFLQREGYHLSALFGIPGYYTKFGYASAIAEAECSLETRNAERATASYEVRPFTAEHAAAVAAVSEALCAERTGSIVRDPAKWTGFRIGAGWTDRVSGFVVLDGTEVLGFASYNCDAFRFGIGEVGYVDARAFDTILAEAARMAVAMRVETIKIAVPPNDAFARHCRHYGCTTKVTYPSQAGGMARICNQRDLLARLQPLFERRLAESPLAGWSGTIVWVTDLGTDSSAFGESAQQYTVKMPQSRLTQLLLGFFSVEDLAYYGDVAIDDAIRPVLAQLCPTGCPYIRLADRF